MNDYGKQHIFDENTVRLIFLSPYVEVRRIENEIFLVRQECDKVITFSVKGEQSVMIINALKNGMEEEMLKEILADVFGKKSEEWIHACIWEGIIE